MLYCESWVTMEGFFIYALEKVVVACERGRVVGCCYKIRDAATELIETVIVIELIVQLKSIPIVCTARVLYKKRLVE